ncbi:hypothetical protein SHXM_02707 [Streptomyces hygroscopicus]|nr:hypothetical protein [Streptomyces hygroscopicus]AQW49244.1 hypothetical protein SHXM_02707 [Streptomyces hygroscopicus]
MTEAPGHEGQASIAVMSSAARKAVAAGVRLKRLQMTGAVAVLDELENPNEDEHFTVGY